MSSSDHPWIYDVFINFRGEDTRLTFYSHLCAALSNAGINTFRDDKKLEKGGELGAELERAIEGSHVSIVILSVNYSQSSWCLNELVKIMECSKTYGQDVLPIFYHVEPSVVRHQKGNFGKALEFAATKKYPDNWMRKLFRKHYRMRKRKLLSEWKRVLTEVGNISGWDATNFRDEGELVQQIVEDILTKIQNTFLPITEFPVGLESRVQQMIEFVENQSSKVCMIGIWGMGGSGKTTTAKAIYNQIHRTFKGRTSFIECIREVCDNNSKGIIHLQEQLLSDLLKIKEKIHSIALGITNITRRLQGQKTLVVLDDVTNFEQLQALCGNPKLFGSGSVLIITTRDLRLLNSLKVDHVFTMVELDENQSLELFSWHAFHQPSPKKDFIQLSMSVIAYCRGLPLALEVLGSYLSNRTGQEWRSALSKLKNIPNNQVQQILRISYDGLEDYMIKDIFLDICCFFIGKNRADVTEILNGCGLHADIGISVLIERSLVKVEKKTNKLQMHDLLRDMGRAIVGESSTKEPAKRSRLWFREDVLDVLSKNTGTETVEGLILKLQRTGRISFDTNAFHEMKKLRLLKLDGVDLIGEYGYISKQLRWVNWQRFTYKCIPDDFYHGNLVVFELKYSNVKQVWQETKLLEKLKILNLSHSKNLKSTPDFSKLPNLEKIIMKDCPSLSEVHQSIGDLKNILLINLKDCTSLNNLPCETYKLKSVKTLILSGCSKIDKLEEDIVQMESLTTLIAANSGVRQVPFSIVRSKSIGYISLCGYEGLSRDVFPSLIWSWMSPVMNSLPRIPTFGGMSMSRISLDVESNSLRLVNQSPILSSCSKLRTFWIQCQSEIHLKQELRRFLDDIYDVNFAKVETTTHASQISNLSLRTLLIGIGSCHTVIDTLGKSLSQGLTTNSRDYILPGSNYPSWLAYTCEGPSVLFQVPENSDCCMKGIALCVLYSSTLENLATECLNSVLIINYTKFTIQIYKRDTVMSFNDEDWQGVVSSLGVGDNVEIFVSFGHGLTVKEMAVYLIYDQSNAMEIEPSITMEVESSRPSDAEMEPSITMVVEPSRPSDFEIEPLHAVEVQISPCVRMEPLPEEEAQPSRDVETESLLIVKNEPLPKKNIKIFRRLAKRVGECLCLNQN